VTEEAAGAAAAEVREVDNHRAVGGRSPSRSAPVFQDVGLRSSVVQ
jgi:hypothetical protein